MVMVQTADKIKKIGLLGGTFDPIHNGHLAVANHVLETLGLDSIWFIPAALPPHKDGHADGRDITSFEQRHAMLQKAIADNSSFVVSDIEAKRSAPSYSIDTINILLQQISKQTDLFFIIGFDAFLEIDTWKQYKDLPLLINFVIISRPGFPPDKVGEVISQNFGGYKTDTSHETWISSHSKGAFILQHMEPVPISSTEIRNKVKNGKNITGLVPHTVEDYIKQQRLYI
jgi:nicotinate-nucleotide adenylyltransferase